MCDIIDGEVVMKCYGCGGRDIFDRSGWCDTCELPANPHDLRDVTMDKVAQDAKADERRKRQRDMDKEIGEESGDGSDGDSDYENCDSGDNDDAHGIISDSAPVQKGRACSSSGKSTKVKIEGPRRLPRVYSKQVKDPTRVMEVTKGNKRKEKFKSRERDRNARGHGIYKDKRVNSGFLAEKRDVDDDVVNIVRVVMHKNKNFSDMTNSTQVAAKCAALLLMDGYKPGARNDGPPFKYRAFVKRLMDVKGGFFEEDDFVQANAERARKLADLVAAEMLPTQLKLFDNRFVKVTTLSEEHQLDKLAETAEYHMSVFNTFCTVRAKVEAGTLSLPA